MDEMCMTTKGIVMGAVLVATALAEPDLQEHTSADDNPSGSNSWTSDTEERQEQWIFVSVTDFGVAPLQEVLREGSDANRAWLRVGKPIESYEPVSMHAPVPNDNNGAVTVLMLPMHSLGDFNNDGRIDMNDLVPFMDAYHQQDAAADLTQDGLVDLYDQLLFIEFSMR